MNDFTANLEKLKKQFSASMGDRIPRCDSTTNDHSSLPSPEKINEVAQQLTTLFANEPELFELVRKTINERINAQSTNKKRTNEVGAQNSFSTLTQMVVKICYTANSMLPDEIESTNEDSLEEIALLRDKSEELGRLLLKWTRDDKREYIDKLESESIIKKLSDEISETVHDSTKIPIKNKIAQLTHVVQHIYSNCMLLEILVDNSRNKACTRL